MKQYWYNDADAGSGSQFDLVRAFQAISEFASAPTWEDTYRALKQHRAILLSDDGLSLVRQVIKEHEAEDDALSILNWRQYLTLLEDAKSTTIAKAWKRFKLLQWQASSAHDAITRASTVPQLYETLRTHEAVLCTDTLKLQLLETSAQEHVARNTATAQHVEKLMRLQTEICAYGLPIAWQRFLNTV
ncbi:MAG TPA: hypothetical protein VNE38_21610 [Ktedonobacteraceae bacterium]|nr:hypothetical protein [Ktedonobacteraceae bacterium]